MRIPLMTPDIVRSSNHDDWDALSLVVRSKYRPPVLRALGAGPLTPSRLAATADLDIAQVSRSLATMREAGLVVLLVPEANRKGRVYRITHRGERVLSLLDETGLA